MSGEPDARGFPYPQIQRSREAFVAKAGSKRFAIGLDAHARMHWGTRNDITGDHVVMVLTEEVGDAHLAALRAAGVSYLFGGKTGIDIPSVFDQLSSTFGIERLPIEGGGRINGSFLKAGVVDEISLLLAPAVDGLSGTPAVFDYEGGPDDGTPKTMSLSLRESETLDGGLIWVRYDVVPS